MRNLSRFLALGGADRFFLLHCLAAVATVRCGLTLLSYDRVRRRIERYGAQAPASVDELRRVAWGVDAAARFVPRATCLTRALAGQYLLARRGKVSSIRIGVRRGSKAELLAHAWLVSGGYVVLGGPARTLADHVHLIDQGQTGR